MTSSNLGPSPSSPLKRWNVRKVAMLALILAAIILIALQMQANGLFSSGGTYQLFVALAGLIVAVIFIRQSRKRR